MSARIDSHAGYGGHKADGTLAAVPQPADRGNHQNRTGTGTRIVLAASDPLTRAGLLMYLLERDDMTVVDRDDPGDADLLLVASTRLSADVLALLRQTAGQTTIPALLIIDEISEGELLIAVRNRVVAILPRKSATADRLTHTIEVTSNGGGVLPPDLAGKLLRQFRQGSWVSGQLASSGFTAREAEVLALIAEGLGTEEIAERLSYSERTIKNVIYGVTNRLRLRNRAHAVAHALRMGVI